ncbi:MAG: hypothetical protein IPN62_14295 [Flavobacteriales bacterium]|nr:hypothetical protein [Flavobacteriales bacterium]
MKRAGLALAGSLACSGLSAQVDSFWSVPSPSRSEVNADRQFVPEQALEIDLSSDRLDLLFGRNVQGVHEVTLPHPSGTVERVRYWPNEVMHPELAARYPGIRTFSGESLDRPGVQVRLDLTEHGFHAMVMDDDQGWWFIDPAAHGIQGRAIVRRKADRRTGAVTSPFQCTYDEVNDLTTIAQQTRTWIQEMGADRVGDCQERTYRLALACTGEYANFHGSNTTNNNKAPALAAMVTTMNRVNAQFERDATLTMVLVPNTDALIYLDPATDPYTNGSGSTMLGQNQSTCDALIGTANYDIGHVFSTGGGGIAQLNSPCSSSGKARGVTGSNMPVGDAFDIDYVAHEMGHQYGANHTQNNACNRASAAAFEPGSASTIMGYAGICAPNIQDNSDAYFHAYSMQEMAANITVGTSSTCPVVTATGNSAPSVNAGMDRTIPRSTPFVLSATGSDPNPGNALSYCWEQMNNQVSTQPPVATSASGPSFRSFAPTTSPDRHFPTLSAVVSGNTPTWEVLSSVARTFNFRVTMRDNVVGGGCNDQDDMTVTVAGSAGPFLVSQPNTNVSWPANSTQTVTWDVAATNTAPVNCANVDILLSLDGGFTYPFTLLTTTPNDGSQLVLLPNIPATTTARVMVKASGNIFYDISNVDFAITANSSPDYTLNIASTTVAVCQPGNAVYDVQTGSVSGYVQPVILGTTGLPNGLTATFGTNPVIPGGTTTLTISGTQNQLPGSYGFDITASSASGNRSVPLMLELKNVPGTVLRTAPLDGAGGVTPGSALTWAGTTSADTYALQIASDAGMVNIIETAQGINSTSYTPGSASDPSTTYHWTVQAVNACGFGEVTTPWSFTTAACIPVQVQVTIDRYGDETTWEVVQGATVVASGGPYAQLPANGVQAQAPLDLCLPAGCYELKVYDSFGDGNCCAYGNGFVRLLDGSATVLANVSQDINAGAPAVVPFCLTAQVSLNARVYLEGPFVVAQSVMHDSLRVHDHIPLQEPYTSLGFAQYGGGGETTTPQVLTTTGNDAIVDWIRVELRAASNNAAVVATLQALLQRDGDVVSVDGTSPLVFNVVPGSYYVAIRHRNHLGCMTLATRTLGGTPTMIDLTLNATSTFGTEARKVIGGNSVLWSGNVLVDELLKYSGVDNDRDPILQAIGGTVPTATSSGYLSADVNMDGLVKYSGVGNDRDPILSNIGGTVPTNTRLEQLP